MEDKFGKDGSKLLRMKGADFNKVSTDIYGAMQSSLAKATGDSLLKNYSPWLHNFDPTSIGHAIEVPGEMGRCGVCACVKWSPQNTGQYDGKSKPLPEYHVKIAGFDEKVVCVHLTSPLRSQGCTPYRLWWLIVVNKCADFWGAKICPQQSVYDCTSVFSVQVCDAQCTCYASGHNHFCCTLSFWSSAWREGKGMVVEQTSVVVW